ncbi:MAG: GNAT family N-acetyltransferase, partial [Pyrinomonadaceae bacterium]|nr:GNAT family N-acetyltransferase [Sphingobacteriaceae bacterium]
MMQFNLLNHKAEYRKYFEQLNKAWLEEYFSVEPIDKWVLENPEQSVLEVGGKILYAEYKGEIIATVGLQKVEEGVYEMIKMTVDKKYRRMGAGKFICLSAIKKAKDLKAQKLVLYS